MADNKRPLDEEATGGELVKRQKTNEGTVAIADQQKPPAVNVSATAPGPILRPWLTVGKLCFILYTVQAYASGSARNAENAALQLAVRDHKYGKLIWLFLQ